MARRRRCINLPFFILVSTQALCMMFQVAVLFVGEDLSEITIQSVKWFPLCVRCLTLAYMNIFMILAHRAMHQVSLHPTSLA